MTFPDATAISGAAEALTSAYNAFPIAASILAIVIILKAVPAVIRLVRRSF